ncbi:MAG: zinc ribbon domain-containing protein [Gammaproteobacteria bacterium]|jgi:putative FmdB family regulatory protein|nr:zinc ribbon domain-containing protein [Gammaproteobacteria bacterium]
MPIYEFYCVDCHTVFNFFSRRIDTEKRPACPRCGRAELQRRMSVFAISKGRKDGDGGDEDFPDLDDERLEKAMEGMAGELEGVDEDDPKAMGRMMRRLFDAAGMRMGAGMEEALRRMEAGEDPDQVEAELGDALEAEDPFAPKAKGKLASLARQYLPPRVDPTLYDL